MNLHVKLCLQIGDALVQMAKVLIIMKEQIEAATIYTAASEIYMRIDKAEGLRSLRSAITIYCDLGRFDIAGRLERRIAQVCNSLFLMIGLFTICLVVQIVALYE